MHARLDRVGKASAQGFRFLNHDDLVSIVSHELEMNNGCFSVGKPWVRTNCIPMGGPFSA